MFETPNVMKMAQMLARHAGARQVQIAKNVANADVPGYRSRDLVEFSETYQQLQPGGEQRITRAKHMTATSTAAPFKAYDVGGEASPNGNTVSVEQELVRAAQAKSDHETALSIYRSSLDVIRASLGRGR